MSALLTRGGRRDGIKYLPHSCSLADFLLSAILFSYHLTDSHSHSLSLSHTRSLFESAARKPQKSAHTRRLVLLPDHAFRGPSGV